MWANYWLNTAPTAEWTETFDSVNEFLGSVRTKSLAMLEAKLEAADANEEFLPTRELVAMAELGLDRTGYGKQTKNVNLNIDFAASLEAARRRSDTARTINPSPPLSPIATPQSRDPQSVLVRNHSPQPGPAPSSFRRRL